MTLHFVWGHLLRKPTVLHIFRKATNDANWDMCIVHSSHHRMGRIKETNMHWVHLFFFSFPAATNCLHKENWEIINSYLLQGWQGHYCFPSVFLGCKGHEAISHSKRFLFFSKTRWKECIGNLPFAIISLVCSSYAPYLQKAPNGSFTQRIKAINQREVVQPIDRKISDYSIHTLYTMQKKFILCQPPCI